MKKKDTFYEERRDADEKLLQKALEQTKAFAALLEANVEAQDGAEKPWYGGDDDSPEGFFSLLQDFPECDWADGGAGDVSDTSEEEEEDTSEEEGAEKDTDEKMLAEPDGEVPTRKSSRLLRNNMQ